MNAILLALFGCGVIVGHLTTSVTAQDNKCTKSETEKQFKAMNDQIANLSGTLDSIKNAVESLISSQTNMKSQIQSIEAAMGGIERMQCVVRAAYALLHKCQIACTHNE
ncbi:unnamed protein product [Owenia fusiformis]|uniref:Uncharacterized protein n=1 Tax=Owenia fusiformis TaxID=6347 RepID=A0A8J1UG83_OWEFU|nr:unnamed protein product [Owenia fusiformis]